MSLIKVNSVSKAYKHYPNRWARLFEWVTPFYKPRHALKWILSDVHFEAKAGEAIGFLGMNGAGKSTLLKMITGTSKPTKGSIEINGSVAAILELGMGFHPDFTGRQNVLMAGQLMGLKLAEINQLMPEIVAFAEVGDYLDQPIRIYSSGMSVRLAFAVATAKRPDVLIIDEALSVGDTYFQGKSFARIREFQKQGTTLLIVAHDVGALRGICNRFIWLENGSIKVEGNQELVDTYSEELRHKQEVIA